MAEIRATLRPLAYSRKALDVPRELTEMRTEIEAEASRLDGTEYDALVDSLDYWLEQLVEHEATLYEARDAFIAANRALHEICRGSEASEPTFPTPKPTATARTPSPKPPPPANDDDNNDDDGGGGGGGGGSGATTKFPRINNWTGTNRSAYRNSFISCSVAGVDEVAREYDAANNPFDAAQAFAEYWYVPASQQAGFEGCYDGFVHIGEASR